MVPHHQFDLLAATPAEQVDPDYAVLRRAPVFHRIVQQVGEDALQDDRVALPAQARFQAGLQLQQAVAAFAGIGA
jgi:hypothetical protein